ncbi:MAG TPA: class I SAM-dependent methyltransferase [Gammaproteobacteria bacterium]|nr:class I SAM-dependent methyltransferase [Gammaproteobacteria bacterium]
MSAQPLLKFIAGQQPIFTNNYSILSAPVRHVFMMGTVWHLCKNQENPNMQILEIGSWVGASALSWGQGLALYNNAKGTITCVDAWKPFFDRETHKDDVYISMEQALGTETAYQIFNHNISTLAAGIECQHLRGQSDNILPLLKPESFDVVFIDADHSYTPVKKDILHSLALVKNGGIICGDDLNLQMSQVDPEVTKKQCEADFIKDVKSGRNYHPGVTLAVHEIFGEVSSWGGFWAMKKQGNAWEKISLADMPIVYPKHFPESALNRATDHLKDITIL